MWDLAYQYYLFYRNYLWTQWENLGPTGYASALSFVALFGWIAMKGRKRS